ncbi:hypothetical protein QOT17_001046 [Balamuthia mandrillaris]
MVMHMQAAGTCLQIGHPWFTMPSCCVSHVKTWRTFWRICSIFLCNTLVEEK